MTDKEWRPKVGERVVIYGTVVRTDAPLPCPAHVLCDGGSIPTRFRYSELSPLPAPAAQREPWEVLREAAEIAEKRGWRPVVTQSMRVLAAELEAAAAPKPPPTLAEAVRAWKELHIDAVQPFARSKEVTDILEALAREEAAAKGDA